MELAFRSSWLDLNDQDITGGEGKVFTLGLNWYLNFNMRFMANYSFARLDENADADGDAIGGDDFSVFQMRFQMIF